jgi:hypothetical protein
VRYAANDGEFRGEGLEIDGGLDVKEREGKMREKVVGRKPWTGPKEVAML